eukprot:maker-scaffold_12-snap-gene-4.43-mRNA-1 protein AED:0.00 eAED:0.00 QI:72/1/1/1/1/1/2/136/280
MSRRKGKVQTFAEAAIAGLTVGSLIYLSVKKNEENREIADKLLEVSNEENEGLDMRVWNVKGVEKQAVKVISEGLCENLLWKFMLGGSREKRMGVLKRVVGNSLSSSDLKFQCCLSRKLSDKDCGELMKVLITYFTYSHPTGLLLQGLETSFHNEYTEDEKEKVRENVDLVRRMLNAWLPNDSLFSSLPLFSDLSTNELNAVRSLDSNLAGGAMQVRRALRTRFRASPEFKQVTHMILASDEWNSAKSFGFNKVESIEIRKQDDPTEFVRLGLFTRSTEV